MSDAAARRGKPFELLGIEHFREEIDQLGCSIHDKIWRDGVIAVGLGLDRHCSLLFLGWHEPKLGSGPARCKGRAVNGRVSNTCFGIASALPSARPAEELMHGAGDSASDAGDPRRLRLA